MNRFHISDTHFYHTNIIRFCERPFSATQEMNEYMIAQWNERVKPGDIVMHYGDLATPRSKDATNLLGRLNGHIILVRGNHDKLSLCKSMPCVVNTAMLNIDGFRCLGNHRPVYPRPMHNKQADPHSDHAKSVSRAQLQDVDFVLSGHIHNNGNTQNGRKVGWLWNGISLNLSVELHGYKPLAEEEVATLLRARFDSLDRPMQVQAHDPTMPYGH